MQSVFILQKAVEKIEFDLYLDCQILIIIIGISNEHKRTKVLGNQEVTALCSVCHFIKFTFK